MQQQESYHQQHRAPDDRLAVLHALISCCEAGNCVTFGFDVQNCTYRAEQIVAPIDETLLQGSMSLSMYNDLKLSQFILESDARSRPGYRWFTMTDRGRRMAERHAA